MKELSDACIWISLILGVLVISGFSYGLGRWHERRIMVPMIVSGTESVYLEGYKDGEVACQHRTISE